MAKEPKYPHEPRPWTVAGKQDNYCLNDGQVWPCATERRRLRFEGRHPRSVKPAEEVENNG